MAGYDDIVEQHNGITPELNAKDITASLSYTSRVEEFVSLLGIQRIEKNRIYGFDFNNEMPATIFILPNTREGNNSVKFPTVFRDFILSSVQEQRTEKFQIFETFGDSALFFFDKKTPVYGFTGFLVDSEHISDALPSRRGNEKSSWANDFRELWDTELRGTQLIKQDKIAVVVYNKNMIWGYPVNMSIQTDAEHPFMAGFSFNMVVKKHKLDGVSGTFLDVKIYMSAEQRVAFDKAMKNLQDKEAALKEMQAGYEEALVAGFPDDELEGILKDINKQSMDAELIYNQVIQLIQAAIMFHFGGGNTTRYLDASIDVTPGIA